MIIFLVWLWITNIVMLLGAELNAEIERGRQIEAGPPAGARALPARPRGAEGVLSASALAGLEVLVRGGADHLGEALAVAQLRLGLFSPR